MNYHLQLLSTTINSSNELLWRNLFCITNLVSLTLFLPFVLWMSDTPVRKQANVENSRNSSVNYLLWCHKPTTECENLNILLCLILCKSYSVLSKTLQIEGNLKFWKIKTRIYINFHFEFKFTFNAVHCL